MSPAEFIMLILLREAPLIAKKPEAETEWRENMVEALELDRRIGSAGALVSPDADAALLDAARWYEARLRERPKDGDCRPEADEKAPRGFRTVCHAFGPLQVTRAAYVAVLATPEGDLAGLQTAKADARKEDLRDPETGVRAGYAALLRWKTLCGGPPARWLTAWGWGRCPPGHTVDGEATRRCELATILLESRGQLPPAWKCGHEGRKIRDEHDRRLLGWAKEHAGLHHDSAE